MAFFRPDIYLSSIEKIDLDTLWQQGVRSFILDLDNTIRPRSTGVIPQSVIEWLKQARRHGFKMMIVSNNWHFSVFDEGKKLDLPVVHKALKPLPFAFFIARHRMGVKRTQTIAVGDQVMTDVWGAHLSGMKAILVVPQATKDLKHMVVLRRVEARILGKNAKPLQ